MQHLPDGSVTVESILVQAAAHSEDPGTKVLLVSWTYQVRAGLVGSPYHPGQAGQGIDQQPFLPVAAGRGARKLPHISAQEGPAPGQLKPRGQ